MSRGNILVKEAKLSAVIDFGCMGSGDPACDLTIAWTFFKNGSRTTFKEGLNLDPSTWDRARGWALWKALYELSEQPDKESLKAREQAWILKTILDENRKLN